MSDTSWLPKRLVCKMFNVTPRTISRWTNDPQLGFPRPKLINGRNYWQASAIEAFKIGLGDAQAAA